MSSRLRDRLKEATAEAILVAAEEVLAEEGVHAASVQAIAARAGVSVGTLYNHFRDRDDIIRALLEARRRAFFQRLDDVIAARPKTKFAELLQVFVDTLMA